MTTIQPFLNLWLLGTVFFFMIFGAFLSSAIMGVQSRRWPTTSGQVVESTVREISSSEDASTFEPVVRYTYEVDGRPHQGNQVALMKVAGSEAGAQSVTSKYPMGEKVTVYHHPKYHSVAVLEPGRFIGPLLGAILTGAVFVFVASIWWRRSTAH